mmetsp:Transcript_4474/g.10678  ORF Transcript_4474/g.10678 Transcript_4474/m.10678 type:complete len:443 (+) Transcript_4474:999-2327(+)
MQVLEIRQLQTEALQRELRREVVQEIHVSRDVVEEEAANVANLIVEIIQLDDLDVVRSQRPRRLLWIQGHVELGHHAGAHVRRVGHDVVDVVVVLVVDDALHDGGAVVSVLSLLADEPQAGLGLHGLGVLLAEAHLLQVRLHLLRFLLGQAEGVLLLLQLLPPELHQHLLHRLRDHSHVAQRLPQHRKVVPRNIDDLQIAHEIHPSHAVRELLPVVVQVVHVRHHAPDAGAEVIHVCIFEVAAEDVAPHVRWLVPFLYGARDGQNLLSNLNGGEVLVPHDAVHGSKVLVLLVEGHGRPALPLVPKVDGIQNHLHELHRVLVVGDGIGLRPADLAGVRGVKEEDARDFPTHLLHLDRHFDGHHTAVAVPSDEVGAVRLHFQHVLNMALGQLVDRQRVVFLQRVDGLVAPPQEAHEGKVGGLAVCDTRRSEEQRPDQTSPQGLH